MHTVIDYSKYTFRLSHRRRNFPLIPGINLEYSSPGPQCTSLPRAAVVSSLPSVEGLADTKAPSDPAYTPPTIPRKVEIWVGQSAISTIENDHDV